MKFIKVIWLLTLLVISIGALNGCNSISSTPTISNPTSEATFTPHPTFTSTPIPYELEVQLGYRRRHSPENARVMLERSAGADDEALFSDAEGKVSWSNLSEDKATLSIFAQGYLPKTEGVTLKRGSNQKNITLVPDAKGLQMTDILQDGETLLYVEDFQDNDEDFTNISGVWSLVEAAEDAGNLVLDIDQKNQEERAGFDTPVEVNTTDFTIEFKLRYLDIDYQLENWTDFYFRDYALSTYMSPNARSVLVLDFNQGNAWQYPITVNKGLADGVWYTFKLEAYENELNFFLDDAQMGRYKDAESLMPSRDYIKYLSFAVAPGSHVQFDDIIIKLANK